MAHETDIVARERFNSNQRLMATLAIWAAVRRRYWVCPGLLLWPSGPLPFRYPSTRRGHTRILGMNQDREMEVIAPVPAREVFGRRRAAV